MSLNWPLAHTLPRWSSWRPWLLSFGAALVLAALLNGIWWSLLSPAANPGVRVYEIPPGTAEAVANGELFAFLPNTLSIPAGSTLRIVNRDVLAHDVGPYQIPSGATLDLGGFDSGSNTYACTIHPSGALNITLNARPGLASLIVPTLLLGLPLGLLVGAATAIVRRIDL